MIGYSSNPDDELKYLEEYRKLLLLEIDRIKNEIKYLEEKIKILQEMNRELGSANISMMERYTQPAYPPMPTYPYEFRRRPAYAEYKYPTYYPIRKAPSEIGKKIMIAVASQDDRGLESMISPVFARAPFFTLIEVEDKEIKKSDVIPNQFSYYGGGAGMSVAQWLIDMGVNMVIAGNFGPNSLGILEQMGIRTLSYPSMPVKEALKKIINP